MTGPSAVGSEKGTPTSMMSTPAASSAGISSRRRLQVGVARRQVGDERLPSLFFQRRESLFDPSHYSFPSLLSAMVSASLSPRPERLMITIRSLAMAGAVFDRMGDGMGALQGGDDPLLPGEGDEGLHRLLVRDGDVAGASRVVEPGVLRPHAGIVEAGGNRVGVPDLAVFVLEEIGLVPVEDADPSRRDARRMEPRVESFPGRLDAGHRHAGIAEEGVEEPQGVASAADAGDEADREAALPF